MFVFWFEVSNLFFFDLFFLHYWYFIRHSLNRFYFIILLIILKSLHKPNPDHFSKHLRNLRTRREITTFVKNGFFGAVVAELWMHQRYFHKSSKGHWCSTSHLNFLFENILESLHSFFFFHGLNLVSRREDTALLGVFEERSTLILER